MTLGERYRRIRPYVLGLYVVAVALGFLYLNMRLTLEWVALILFVAAILSGRALMFLRDWGVFILVLFAWQLVSPIATYFHFPWHLSELIDADRVMFLGSVPPLWLQQHLYHPGVLEPWDVLAASMYMLHFLAPLLAGFAIWLTNRELFGKFAVTFVVVAVAGFATYIVYPAVPPWMAAQPLIHVGYQYVYPWKDTAQFHGSLNVAWAHSRVYLPGVKNLFLDIASRWYNPYHGNISLGFMHLHYDQVGAIPSEHAAYPFLFFLFLRRQFGRPAYLVLIYIAALLFSITYLGQHYVVDAVVGFVYAGCGYAIVMHGVPALSRRFSPQPESLPIARPIPRRELEQA